MSHPPDTEYQSGFGKVSRTVGILFRYLLLAATLVGIVALGILLIYVANDAFQPLTADHGWHATYLLTMVLPTLLTASYLHRTTNGALPVGVMALGILLVSLLFAGGVSMVFIDILAPPVWFAYFLAICLSLLAIVGIERYNHRYSFGLRFTATLASVFLALYAVPTVFDRIGIAPVDWLIITFTLGGPAALIVAGYTATIRDRRTGITVGALTLGVITSSAFIGPLVGINPVPATVITTVAIVPTSTYAAGVMLTRPAQRQGLMIPGIVLSGTLIGAVLVDQFGFAGPQSWVDWQFLTSAHSGTAEAAGLYPAIGGSILLMTTVAAFSFPLGVGAAVYLEEYAGNNTLTRVIDINISNLAGVPSVVYGLLGLGVFVTYLGQPTGTVLIGGATLALLILPIVIISAREAIRSVPADMRQASYGVGATRYQTIKNIVLPRAFPGILTGTILALGRAIGETAPLIMIGAPNVVFNLPTSLSSKVSAMPLQVYAWSSYFAGPDFYQKAVPAGVVVLLVVLLSMNSIAIVLRNKYQDAT